MAPTQSSKGWKGKAVSSRSNQSSTKAVVVHGSSNWSGQSQTQKGKTSSSWAHQESKTQLGVSQKGSQVVFKQQACSNYTSKGGKGKVVSSGSNQSSTKAVVVRGCSNWSGQSHTQKGKTSSSWAHQESMTQMGVSMKGSQVVFTQQSVNKNTNISTEKFQGFTKEVKEQISAKKTVTYKMDTAAPKFLGPKTNNKKLEIMDRNPKPKPNPKAVNQKAVTMNFSFTFPM